jgi:hypothetical protein
MLALHALPRPIVHSPTFSARDFHFTKSAFLDRVDRESILQLFEKSAQVSCMIRFLVMRWQISLREHLPIEQVVNLSRFD